MDCHPFAVELPVKKDKLEKFSVAIVHYFFWYNHITCFILCRHVAVNIRRIHPNSTFFCLLRKFTRHRSSHYVYKKKSSFAFHMVWERLYTPSIDTTFKRIASSILILHGVFQLQCVNGLSIKSNGTIKGITFSTTKYA